MISEPRWAGRQCMTIASGRAAAMTAAFTWNRLKTSARELLLVLLAHRGPHVGVDGVGVCRRLPGVVHDERLTAGRRTDLVGVADHLLQRLEAGRAGDVHAHAGRRAGEQQRVGHVVAVADVGERAALEVALDLAQRLQVGERLAGMGEIGERIDDRHVGAGGELFEPILTEGAHDDGVDVAAEHCRGVAQRLAATELGGAGVDDHRVCRRARGCRPRTTSASGWKAFRR